MRVCVRARACAGSRDGSGSFPFDVVIAAALQGSNSDFLRALKFVRMLKLIRAVKVPPQPPAPYRTHT